MLKTSKKFHGHQPSSMIAAKGPISHLPEVKMFKRLTVAVAALFVLSASAFGAGTIPGFSLAQQQDSNGTPLVGCRLYTIQAGTVSTPQSAYQDSGLTIPLPNPIICDAYGRLPQIFLADGSIKLRLTKSNGTQVFAADGILVVGASSGGGGGSPVDPTTVLATGDMKIVYGTGVLNGFVRANGRTIGSATSGATERANADCQALFLYLWSADVNLAVSGGRGASAAADWAANKTITLPSGRGRSMVGLADMGNTATTLLDGVTFESSGTATALGSRAGASFRTITTPNLPAYTPSGSVSITSGTNLMVTNAATIQGGPGPGSTWVGTGAVNLSASFTGTAQGGTSTAMETISPLLLVTIYLKL